MKKYALSLSLALLIFNWAAAQTISISGTVKTSQGDPLHFAFVQDKQYKYATYTDSLGNFSLTVNPNSTLRVNCQGFKDTTISINNKTTFSIILKPLVNIIGAKSGIPATVNPNSNINMATFRDEIQLNEPGIPTPGVVQGTVVSTTGGTMGYGSSRPVVTNEGPDMAQGAIFPVFTHKEATVGSRYLFNSWVQGFVINVKDSLIQNPSFFFNYDKIGGNLLLSKDKHAAIEVYKDLIKSFTLFDAINQQYTFTLVPSIDKTRFVQVVTTGSKYQIYKLTKTSFVASSYATDGIASSGNRYDEYVDDDTYYIIGKSGVPKKVSLRKKSLKEAFSDDQDKFNQYLTANDGDIDENYLKDLGDYMNK